MEKKTDRTNELLEQVIYRLNDSLQNQLSIESQGETIKKFEEQLQEIKEAIKKQTEILDTLKTYIIPGIICLCILVALISYYVRKGL